METKNIKQFKLNREDRVTILFVDGVIRISINDDAPIIPKTIRMNGKGDLLPTVVNGETVLKPAKMNLTCELD